MRPSIQRVLTLDAPRQGGTGGAWVWWRDAAAGGARDNWATCLHLLEHAAAAADVACDGVASTAASSTRVGGGLSSFLAANGRR